MPPLGDVNLIRWLLGDWCPEPFAATGPIATLGPIAAGPEPVPSSETGLMEMCVVGDADAAAGGRDAAARGCDAVVVGDGLCWADGAAGGGLGAAAAGGLAGVDGAAGGALVPPLPGPCRTNRVCRHV